MKIHKLLIAVLFYALLAPALQAQNRYTVSADDAFGNLRYSIAADKYKKAYSKTKSRSEKTRIAFQMAECYRFMNEPKRAEPNYKRAIKMGYAAENPIVLLHYADALKSTKKFDQAIEQYQAYIDQKPDDPRGPNGVKSCELALEWNDLGTNYIIENVKKINTPESDFSPTYADKFYNAVIFTSTREGSTGKGTDEWTNESFSDLYYAKQDRKGVWSAPTLADKNEKVNTADNEGSPSMDPSFRNLYFTRCETEANTRACQIYVARKAGNSFGDPKMISLSKDSTITNAHPAISSDELTLIYVSNRKSGKGGKDLYIAKRKSASEEFGLPRNMGPVINTPGDEMFPFLRGDSTLYFASNGHIGMGGLDIFKSTMENGEWTEPINLKPPINSTDDDFGIVFKAEGEEGLFCSNRKGGRGNDDIWYFINPPLEFTMQGVIKDDRTLQFVPGAAVTMTGSNGTSVEAKTDEKGFYSFSKSQIKPNTTYDIEVNKDNYFTGKARETTVGVEKNKDFVRDFILEPIPEEPILLPEILYDLAKWDLKPQYQDSLQGLILIMEQNPTIIVELAAHTDARDIEERNDILSQKRAESVVNYLILRGIDPQRLVAKGYGERIPRTLHKDIIRDGATFSSGTILTEDYIKTLANDNIRETAHQMNRRTEFRVLSKDFVPKDQNSQLASGTVKVQLNPEENSIPIVYTQKSWTAEVTINGYRTTFTFDQRDQGIIVSLNQALDWLRSGSISKNDFIGDPEKILSEGSIADKAEFTIANMRMGNKELTNVKVVVSHKIETNLIIGESAINNFGDYEINKEKSLLLFK